jgi:protoporphyrinogen oxidase
MSRHVVILGGGLAGLSCAYELARAGLRVTVIEREPQVGGMAASFTVEVDGESFSYDFGPHRFHTHDPELIAHVREVLGDNHVMANRLSRILLFGRFFDYPLQAGNVLRSLPPVILVRSFLDYFWVRFTERSHLSHHSDENFEGWVVKRFGRTLYELFFGRYTAKTWKMSPREISGDWASQRISQLSLGDTVKQTLLRPKEAPRSLVTEFIYPRVGGIGEISRGYAREIEARGGRVIVGAPVTRVHTEDHRVTEISYGGPEPGTVSGDRYISTIPVTVLARMVRPAAPPEVLEGLAGLRHVSIVFIYLRLATPQVSPDNWVYLPDRDLTIHRISEFKNFSPDSAPADKTMLCAEITCRLGDEHWRASDEELIATAAGDLAQIGLIEPEQVLGGFVSKLPHAYPVYDLQYKANLAPILEFVHRIENLETGGRQGLFRYNNMDQSIEMGRLMATGIIERRDAGHESVATEPEYFG